MPPTSHLGRTVFRLGEDPVRAALERLDAGCPGSSGSRAAVLAPAAGGEVRVTLGDVLLRRSVDWDGIHHRNALTGENQWLRRAADNELYAVGVAWDLSGSAPQVFPLASGRLDPASLVHDTYEGEPMPGLLDGIQLYRGEPRGGLFVELLIGESDGGTRKLGAKLALIDEAIRDSGLLEALAPLAGAEPGAATLALVAGAALSLADLLGAVMAADEDDVVSVYQGTIGLDGLAGTRTARYADAGTEITLQVSAPPRPPGVARPLASGVSR